MELVEDKVKLPNGQEIVYLVAPAHHHSVAVLAMNESQEILFQREYSYPPDVIMWQLPGGEIEEGEHICEAAKRELSEESGYSAKHCQVIGFYYTDNRRSNAKQYIVICTGIVSKSKEGDLEEFIESQWVSLDHIARLMDRGELQNIHLLAALKLWDHYKTSSSVQEMGGFQGLNEPEKE